MTSIRTYLIVALLSTITLVNFLAALQGYRAGMERAEELLDAQLESQVRILETFFTDASGAASSTENKKPLLAVLQTHNSDHAASVFQIWRVDANAQASLQLSSVDLPDTPIAALQVGYHFINLNNQRWKALVSTRQGLWFIAAHKDESRQLLAETITSASIWPTILSVPISGLIIWYLVGTGLQPIRRLAVEVRSKKASDLSPVNLHRLPRELLDLAGSTNDLLQRLNAAFIREKQFSADAAHELRTPISILKLQIGNLLAESNPPSPTAEKLKVAIDRMSHLVEQLLALSRAAPDNSRSTFVPLDLHQLAQQVIADDYAMMEAKLQTVELKGDAADILGDRFGIQTLLKNLLDNASKYTPANGFITVSITRSDAVVVLEVMDSGPGIAAEDYARVFDRFYRAGGDRHGSDTIGCGLGLAIVKNIVTAHGAEIELGKSAFASGLSVRIRFNAH